MSTDTPLDLDALLERFGDAYAAAYVEQTDASDARREEAAEAIRAALTAARAEVSALTEHAAVLGSAGAALEQELAAARAERDEERRLRVSAATVANEMIEHAKTRRDEAIEQAKQAQAELAALQVQYAGVQMERDLANEQLRGWRKRAARQRNTAERSMWNETALALLLHAKHVILRAARAHCADDPWRKDASRWVQNHDAFTGTEDCAAPNADEPFTTPCVAAELGVAHPAHTVSAKAAINCPGAERKYTVSPDDCACMEVAHLGDPKCPRCGRELSWELPAAAPDPADAPKCGHQHARLLRQPGDRPILCTLPAGHDGDHGEPETGSHWDRDSFFGNVATSDPRRVDVAPVPAGGEDGSGTADGHRQDAGHA